MTAHKRFLQHLEKLSNGELIINACKKYKRSDDSFAFELNGRLKSGMDTQSFVADFENLRLAIRGAFNKKKILYRMTSSAEFSASVIDALSRKVRYPAFMSTTDCPEILERFIPGGQEPLLLKIECLPGFAVAPLDFVNGVIEGEFLFGPGTTFEIMTAPAKIDQDTAREYISTFGGNSLTLLELKAVANPPYVSNMDFTI